MLEPQGMDKEVLSWVCQTDARRVRQGLMK